MHEGRTGIDYPGALKTFWRILLIVVVCGRPIHAFGQRVPPRVRIIEELRLKASDEDFPAVTRLYVGPNDQIVVPLAADMQLRIYHSTGKRAAVIGGRGAGPGEFWSFGGLGWIKDTLWIADPQQRRTTFVNGRFEAVRTERWQGGTVIDHGQRIEVTAFPPSAFLSNGSILGRLRWVPLGDRGSQEQYREAFAIRLRDGMIREVLRLASGSEAPWAISYACCTFSVPFTLPPQYAVAFDGQHFAELSAPIPTERDSWFRVTLFRFTGDTVFSRKFPYRGEPISQRIRDSALTRVVPAPRHLLNVPPDLSDRVLQESRARMPAWYVGAKQILIGLDRTLWVELRTTAETNQYLILGSNGDPIGQLLLPPATRLQQATAASIWVTESDVDGVADVVRYRVIGLACVAVRC